MDVTSREYKMGMRLGTDHSRDSRELPSRRCGYVSCIATSTVGDGAGGLWMACTQYTIAQAQDKPLSVLHGLGFTTIGPRFKVALAASLSVFTLWMRLLPEVAAHVLSTKSQFKDTHRDRFCKSASQDTCPYDA